MFLKVPVTVVLLFAAGICGAAQNLLLNPSFEEVPALQEIDDWDVAGGDVFVTWEKEAHAGYYSVKFWWAGRLSQKVKGVPSEKYELSAWVSNPASDPLAPNGSKFAKLKIEFLNSDMHPIYTASSSNIDKSFEAGRWFRVKIVETAPAGTAYINVVFRMFGGTGAGSLLIDDIQLTAAGKSNKTFDENGKKKSSGKIK
ncbi:MAG: hypothetical protein JW983_04830 [Elusimicrobia bacterium]|nr:hypothetical protein [Elusimicrobiota bacterium]